jgi:predicted PhzF superfamily epimerase YddE/YHI9
MDTIGVIVTAPGNNSDFVSRFFAPGAGIPEDPVTGSAHCNLIPYWAKRLGKNSLHAYQISARRGELWCELKGDRVQMSGKAVTYLKGEIRF